MTLVDENSCDQPKRFNLLYNSSLEKYTVLTDTSNCSSLIVIESIEATKIQDYPTDEFLHICTMYYKFEEKTCIDEIPDEYFCNDTDSMIIYKCQDKCATCEKGLTNDNNNC